jgi:proteasome lid subunit RPN8/RPN11
MVITDLVYEDIRAHIAQHQPERGGALYGPRNYPFVTHFEFDPDAETSSVSYVPSSRLIAHVPRVEAETGLQFKGIIHSHPSGITRPSGGDEQTIASFFRMNPHVSTVALPIVQPVHGRGQSEFMHWYRAERRGEAARSRPVEVIMEEFHVIPLASHVAQLVRGLASHGFHMTVSPKIQPLRVQNAELVGLVAASSQGHEFMYFVSLDYPVLAPVVLYQKRANTEYLRFCWDGMGDPADSLPQIVELLSQEWRHA